LFTLTDFSEKAIVRASIKTIEEMFTFRNGVLGIVEKRR